MDKDKKAYVVSKRMIINCLNSQFNKSLMIILYKGYVCLEEYESHTTLMTEFCVCYPCVHL